VAPDLQVVVPAPGSDDVQVLDEDVKLLDEAGDGLGNGKAATTSRRERRS
jgi:hypothetical protein